MTRIARSVAVLVVWIGMSGGLAAQFTETAGTVAAGQWRVEADLLNFGQQDFGEGRYEYLAAGYVLVSRGWTERWDVQAALQSYLRETIHWNDHLHGEERYTADPVLYLRTKYRLIGADAEAWSSSLLPMLVLPTGRDSDGHRFLDLGLVIPVSGPIGDDWWFDGQVQLDGYKVAGASRAWSWLVSANVQRSLAKGFTVYVEGITSVWEGRWSHASHSAGIGLSRTGARGAGWDVAIYRGLNEHALDWEFALRAFWEP